MHERRLFPTTHPGTIKGSATVQLAPENPEGQTQTGGVTWRSQVPLTHTADPQVRRRMVNEIRCSVVDPDTVSASLTVYSPSSSAPGVDSPRRATTTSLSKGPALSSVPGEEEEQSIDPTVRRWTGDPPLRTLFFVL